MSVFIILLAVLCIIGIKVDLKDGFPDYCSKENTTAIKGIFVIVVFFCHVWGYMDGEYGVYDKLFFYATQYFDQLCVVAFLMYSGYGVAVAIKNKPGYIDTIPVRRVFKVWYHFAIAVTLFVILNCFMGEKYGLQQTLLAYTGYTSIGNSNWFIFDIICLYLITYASFRIMKKTDLTVGALLVTVSTTLLAVVLQLVQDGHWWYDTLLCYPLGMWTKRYCRTDSCA